MPRMIDLIRSSSVPSNLMQSAARGALSVPAEEMIEILVYLATQTKIFSERARLTLAAWDESSSRSVAGDPKAPKAVLDYLVDPGNLRPALLPALLENPSVSHESLANLASSASRYVVETILKSERVGHSPEILTALNSNPHLNEIQSRIVKEKLAHLGPETRGKSETTPAFGEAATAAGHSVSSEAESAEMASSETSPEDVPEETVTAYLTEHAVEISAEADKRFQPIGGVHEELTHGAEEVQAEPASAVGAATSAMAQAAAPQRAPIKKKSFLGAGHEKGNALQKIAQLDVKGRIQLAMKGNKEERSLLIRDGTKVVAIAVLESPKLTDSEVEKFAGQKNVLEAVLRSISMKRRFVKQYPVLRQLVFNPRTPIDVSLGLIKNLLVQDLRNLAGNKEVSETVRKLALRMFRQKLEIKKD